MREFKSVSASQISNYRDCARKWWYQSILGLQTPQNASAALGEAVHAQLEAYLNDGDYPDTAKTAGRIAEGHAQHRASVGIATPRENLAALRPVDDATSLYPS